MATRRRSAQALQSRGGFRQRLEEARFLYAIRRPANSVLREKIALRLTRPAGRPSLTKVKWFYNQRGAAETEHGGFSV